MRKSLQRPRLDDDLDEPANAVFGSNTGEVSPVALTRAVDVGNNSDTLASDLLIGCEQITVFIFGKATWPLKKRVYRWIATGDLPAGRLGGQLVTTKQKIRGRLDALIGA